MVGNVKHAPATALPWKATAPIGSPKVSVVGRVDPVTGVLPRGLDAAYIVHAANGYPLAIRAAQRALAALRALGHENVQGARDAEALLRELGEAA